MEDKWRKSDCGPAVTFEVWWKSSGRETGTGSIRCVLALKGMRK